MMPERVQSDMVMPTRRGEIAIFYEKEGEKVKICAPEYYGVHIILLEDRRIVDEYLWDAKYEVRREVQRMGGIASRQLSDWARENTNTLWSLLK